MSTEFRVQTQASRDNTGRLITRNATAVAYAATVALAASAEKNLFQFAQLTGACTITLKVGTSTTGPKVGDTAEFLFTADGTNRVVTFGTGFVSAGTLTVTASKGAYASFIFNGVAWQEMARTIYA